MKIITVINNFCDAGDAPRWYCKADTSLLRNNDAFYIPDSMGRIAAEPQIVIRISRLAKCIGERFAPRCYDEVALGVNFTAVDMLDRLRSDSLPWEHAVGFDHSAALSNSTLGRERLRDGMRFTIDGEERLTTGTDAMRFTVDRIVSCLSHAMTLRIGDLIYLGSPERFDVAAGCNYRVALGADTLLDFVIK